MENETKKGCPHLSHTLNLNVFVAYLYAINNDIKLYAMQNTIVAIPNVNIGIFICIIYQLTI